jgi:hypothetical protein
LAAGETHPSVPELGAVSVGEALDALVRVGLACGLAHLGARCVETPVVDVLQGGFVEQEGVLADDGEVVPPVRDLVLAEVVSRGMRPRLGS